MSGNPAGDARDAERTHPNLVLAVLALAGLAYAMLSSSIIPALPTIQHSLHTTVTGVTWLLTAYLLAASVGTAILGRLGDMYGKERLLLITLVILAFGTLLAAVSSSLGVLIVARFIQGASGGIFPLAYGIVRDEFPRERVAGSIGLLSAIKNQLTPEQQSKLREFAKDGVTQLEQALRNRLTEKVERVQEGAQKWAASGRDPKAIAQALEEKFKPLMDAGKPLEAEAELDRLLEQLQQNPK